MKLLIHDPKKIIFLEFDKVWVHGLLHLLGYDHIKNKDYFKMNKIEKRNFKFNLFNLNLTSLLNNKFLLYF